MKRPCLGFGQVPQQNDHKLFMNSSPAWNDTVNEAPVLYRFRRFLLFIIKHNIKVHVMKCSSVISVIYERYKIQYVYSIIIMNLAVSYSSTKQVMYFSSWTFRFMNTLHESWLSWSVCFRIHEIDTCRSFHPVDHGYYENMMINKYEKKFA